MDKTLIYDLDFEELSDKLAELGEPSFRARQVWNGLYHQLSTDFSQFSNVPGSLRAKLAESYHFDPVVVEQQIRSRDGETEKTLFRLADGALIETVLMRYRDRNSLCISTQVGCPMDCIFCATGQMGFSRNLSSGEILGQILFYMRKLQEKNTSLTNIVYMGMGEPFVNYEETMKSVAMLNDSSGLNFGARRITISTVGIIPKILEFTQAGIQVNLAVSLHAPDDELRNQLVPANRFYPIAQLLEACRAYTDQTHRRVTFEYALIADVNDSVTQAKDLAILLRGMLCHVNLIALNPSKGYALRGSEKDVVDAFAAELQERGIPTTVRLRRGIEIQAGCGQLASAQQS